MTELALAAVIAGGFGLAGTVLGSVLNRATANRLQELSNQLERATQHETERHRFRHQMGQFAAQERLNAYVHIAELAMKAYRAKMGRDWNDTALMKKAAAANHKLLNYYYDYRFFFSEGKAGLEGAVRDLAASLKEEFPSKVTVEANLRRVSNTVRKDLLLDELADSATRAIGQAATSEASVTVTTS